MQDLTGFTFGKLKVLYRICDHISPKGEHRSRWHCICECGTECDILGDNLRNGHTKSCGCLRKQKLHDKADDLTGKIFGKLTALYKYNTNKENKRNKVEWMCKCECGNTIIVLADNLRSGNTTSCGCLHPYRENWSGEQFGKLTVLKEVPQVTKNCRRMLCRCKCGNLTEVDLNHLTSKDTISCGCVKSKGERQISAILNSFNIPFTQEFSFDDLYYKNLSYPLRFDFCIYDDIKKTKIIYLIEYQGEQHFVNKWGIPQTEWEESLQRDKLKKDYCKEHNIPLIEIKYNEEITADKILMFKTKGVNEEDFIQYQIPSMFITNTKCNGFKCDKENGYQLCINSKLITTKTIYVTYYSLIQRYLNNPITRAIVFGGLENFDEFDQLKSIIQCFRQYTMDDIVIYTGFYKNEITEQINWLKQYPNIIIKFGRFQLGNESHIDPVLGINLMSDNQYAERIS